MGDKNLSKEFHCDDILLDCTAKLDAVLAVSKSIMGIMDPNEVLNSVIYKLGKQLGYSFPAIFLFDEPRSNLIVKKIGVTPKDKQSFEEWFHKDFDKLSVSVHAKQNIIVRAALDNSIVVSKDFSRFTQPFLADHQAELLEKHLDVHTVIAVPLVMHGDPVGVMVAFSKFDSLDNSEQVLLQTLANQVSISLYNAQLFSQVQAQIDSLDSQKQDLEALLDLSRLVISRIDKEEVMQQMLNLLPEKFSHLGMMGAGLFLMNREKSAVNLYAMTEGELADNIQEITEIKFGEYDHSVSASDVLKEAASRKDLVLFHDLHKAFPDSLRRSVLKKLEKLFGDISYIAAPVLQEKQIVGILIFAIRNHRSRIDERLREILLVFANQMEETLEHVELYGQLQRQYEKVQRQREALAAANEKLKALDEAKSEFISIASHQLRTPLTVIRGYLSLILEGSAGKCDAVAMEGLSKVAVSTNRLVALVNDLLDISKIERGIMSLDQQPTRMEYLAESVVDELEDNARKNGLTLTYHRPRHATPHVNIDKKTIREVMMNMVDNAIKYTQKGKVDVYVKKEKESVVFIVHDTGMGLSEETIPRLFEKFSRGEGVSVIDTEGVGLGLFVAKRIIDAHNGKIWATSEGKGKGSVFEFSIPIPKKKKK